MRIPVGKWRIDILKKLSNLCIGTCVLEPKIATPLPHMQLRDTILPSIYFVVLLPN